MEENVINTRFTDQSVFFAIVLQLELELCRKFSTLAAVALPLGPSELQQQFLFSCSHGLFLLKDKKSFNLEM